MPQMANVYAVGKYDQRLRLVPEQPLPPRAGSPDGLSIVRVISHTDSSGILTRRLLVRQAEAKGIKLDAKTVTSGPARVASARAYQIASQSRRLAASP